MSSDTMDVRFVDTTFRDGSQSLWAMGIRYGMMEPLATDLDNAGYDVVEVPANPIHFKKFVRDLKEDPWDVMRMLATRMPKTLKGCMSGGGNLNPLGVPTPPVLGDLFQQRLIDMGALTRVQMVCNTTDQLTRVMPRSVPKLQGMGYQVAIALSYSISPRHTDEDYAAKAAAVAALKPDRIYLKDQSGLLTVERLRTLIPIITSAAGTIPVELHAHCSTGLAPSVYAEAMRLGVGVLHCGIPPLSDGTAQPSALDVARNARLAGHNVSLDEALITSISERLTEMGIEAGLPAGAPARYDERQYGHQIPGGVISNLRFQLSEIGLAHRLDDVLDECVRVRADLGYPIMITPFSQYVATQATINIATGKRYGHVIDELIRMAQGAYGEDSGYTWMDADLRDQLTGSARAAELAALASVSSGDLTLAQAKAQYGSVSTPDEEILLRAIMQGTEDIDAMRAAGAPRSFGGDSLLRLMRTIGANGSADPVRYIHIRRGESTLALHRSTEA